MALSEISVDTRNLYREEIITDLKIATLRVLVPVKVDGSVDASRPSLYMGQTQLMSQAGPLPVSAPIEAATLQEAIAKFPAAIQQAVEQLLEEVRELQRREASRIVVPSMMPAGPPGRGGSFGGGGLGGGGIITG
jgi:hypothetical protein